MDTVGVSIELPLKWGAVIVVTISFAGLAYLFREQFKSFLKDAKKLVLGIGPVRLELERLDKVQDQINDAGVATTPSTAESMALRQRPDFSARDLVLQNWGSLKQLVSDVAAQKNVPFTPSMSVTEVIERLLDEKLIPSDIAEPIVVLYEDGKDVYEKSAEAEKSYALAYAELVNRIIDGMMSGAITAPDRKPEKPKPKLERHTRVSSYFLRPSPGHPTAVLVGVSGVMKGKRLAIEQEICHIGAGPKNELVIQGDDYVSHNHATVQYKAGSLYLVDEHSRNGTFLNKHQLSDRPMTLSLGDVIRMGNSTLCLEQAVRSDVTPTRPIRGDDGSVPPLEPVP